jgi:hypothetical protein
MGWLTELASSFSLCLFVYQFEWRPRPPSLLSGEQQRKVRKDLRKFERRFDKVRSPVGYCIDTCLYSVAFV